jgi:hypothetical protein
MIKRTIAAIALILALTGCGPEPEAKPDPIDASDIPGLTGVVVEKTVDPERSHTICKQRRSGRCVKREKVVDDDTDYILEIRDDKTTGNVWVDVDKAVYDSKREGDRYP